MRTLYQLRNLIARTNVNKKPEKDFNVCDDFFQLVITCYILTASLEFLKMKSLSDIPSGDDLPNAWMNSAEYTQNVLADVCDGVVDQFISFSFNENGKIHKDKVYNYNMHLISLGSFYLEDVDAIKGDGQRVLICWKYLLPIFKSFGRKFKLTPRQFAELFYNRFVAVNSSLPLDSMLNYFIIVL